MKSFEYRVPGGKLLRTKVETLGGKISFVQISGDFFITPENDLKDLEKTLLGLEADPVSIEDKVTGFFHERATVITGATPQDFAHCIIIASQPNS
jgi:hypothetical protein